MEEEDLQDIVEFAKQCPKIEAVYLGRKPDSQIEKEREENKDPFTVYFYIPRYRWTKDKEVQTKIEELDYNLGLEMGMMAIWRSPEEAKKQKRLEKIIWEKNQ